MRGRRRRSDREGEAAFYLLVGIAAILSLLFYWKIFLLIAAIAAVLFLVLRKSGSSPVAIDPIEESFSDFQQRFEHGSTKQFIDPAERQRAFRSTTKQKGAEFEAYVANHYRLNGYDVLEHGKIYGRKDQGIDLIATKGDEVILIQCKNWKASGRYSITHSHIKEFIGNTAVFLEKTPMYWGGNIQRLFVTSENIFDNSAIGYLRNNPDIIGYRVIPMPSEY